MSVSIAVSDPDAPVLCAVAGGVATVTLNRPERMNAWTHVIEVAYFDLVDANASLVPANEWVWITNPSPSA